MPFDFNELEKRAQQRREALEEYARAVLAANKLMPQLTQCIQAAQRCYNAFANLDTEARNAMSGDVIKAAIAVNWYMRDVTKLLDSAVDRRGYVHQPTPAEGFLQLLEAFKPADRSPWVENGGYTPPLPLDTLLEVILRSGATTCKQVGWFDWRLDPTEPNDGDILRWRVATTQEN